MPISEDLLPTPPTFPPSEPEFVPGPAALLDDAQPADAMTDEAGSAAFDPAASTEPAEDAGEEPTIVIDRRPKAEWQLRLPDDSTVLVDGVLLLGRKPQSSAGPAGARVVVVDDPGRTVSRSHLVVEPNPGVGVVLTDVSTSNGIILIAPGGGESEIEPGGAVLITDACSIVLGAYAIAIERV